MPARSTAGAAWDEQIADMKSVVNAAAGAPSDLAVGPRRSIVVTRRIAAGMPDGMRIAAVLVEGSTDEVYMQVAAVEDA